MRIFTVASEELISKPVSLVSMVKTERKENVGGGREGGGIRGKGESGSGKNNLKKSKSSNSHICIR